MRSAYTRRRSWQERLQEAESVEDEDGMREAAKFIAEYEDFIAELEKQARAGTPDQQD